ncbi:hypothetical protein Cs7R123_63330 [Catellatospora sp. TT07R-123]|uniref:hypothetical protein n=1 Tax=Catellatospora sp. TT07R-123 TaxID=2733863 RepID=UPI001B09E17C|nr:hypothetical protein [Catellatospora sp. TT07R-123]GHJ48991.1 hypothetical protein Cs7R123_63330 [Catellatospora sp. TT07R-123]
MTLTLRPFVDVAPIPDGVYFSGPTSQFVMKGWSGLYQVASVCVKLLAGGATEPELVAVFGTPKVEPVVRRILHGLSEHGMLLTEKDAGDLGAAPRGAAGHALAFLEAVSSEPHGAFERLRGGKLAVRGLPASGAAVVATLLEIGFSQVSCSESDGDLDVDGVLCCVARPEELSGITLPGAAETLVVPVLLGDVLRVAGPAVSRKDLPTVAEIWKRADRWRRDGTAPDAEVADAFALGFAGHLLFDALAGLATGTFAVVHGHQPAVDRPAYTPRAVIEPSARLRLESVDSAEVAVPQVLAAVVDMSKEWTGLFASGPGEKTLPQVPLALREIELREGPSRENVASWGPDQEAATLVIAVDGVRLMGAAPAGLTAERWLLDGVLRLLADEAEYTGDSTDAMCDADGRRVRRALAVSGVGELQLKVSALPGVDWPMVSAHDEDGAMLAAAWAEDERGAGFEALATVLASRQVSAAGQAATMSRLRTGRLVYGDPERISRLRAQLCDYLAASGRRAEGRPSGSDPVLGQLPFWTGSVQLVPAEGVCR